MSEAAAGRRKLNVDVVARGVRVRADLLVRFLRERGELRLRQRAILDLQLDRQPEATRLAGTDAHCRGHLGLAGVLLLALGDEIERAAEARGVAGGEQMLRGRGSRLARPAHFLRHREIGLHDAVARFGVPVAAAGGGRGGGEKRLDLVHRCSPWSNGQPSRGRR